MCPGLTDIIMHKIKIELHVIIQVGFKQRELSHVALEIPVIGF